MDRQGKLKKMKSCRTNPSRPTGYKTGFVFKPAYVARRLMGVVEAVEKV